MRIWAAAMLVSTAASADSTGVVEGEVRVIKEGFLGRKSETQDRSNVVVEIDLPGNPPNPPPTHREMRQENYQFQPSFVAIVKGARVAFPNHDHEEHGVYSLSETRPFNLPEFKSGVSPSVTFDRDGLVEVACRLHPAMAGVIRVLKSHWFEVTKESGRFRIAGVPPGRHAVTIWPLRGDPTHLDVVVRPDAAVSISAQVTEGRPKSRYHPNADGRAYPDYR